MKGSIAFLVALLLLLTVALAACSEPAVSPTPDDESPPEAPPAEEPEGESPEDEQPEEQEPLPEVELTSMKALTKDQKTEYVVVYDDQIDNESLAQIRRFRIKFYQKTGVELQLRPDTDEPCDREILIGNMDGREGASETLAALQAPGQNGYRIAFSGEKLVVAYSETP